MNKYRLIDEVEVYEIYQCLACKNKFLTFKDPMKEGWIACPFCMVKWDGPFNIKHPRYPVKYKLYQTDFKKMWAEVPTLVLQERTWVETALHKDAFLAEYNIKNGYWTQWSPMHWGTLGTLNCLRGGYDRVSAAVALWHSYKSSKADSIHPHLREMRIVLLNGSDMKIVASKILDGRAFAVPTPKYRIMGSG